MIFPRSIYQPLLADLDLYPVVTLMGARQVGKTTLCRQIANQRGFAYRTLDDHDIRHQATEDPEGLLADLGGNGAVIDEIQRAPDLLLSVKAAVDRNGRPNQYLLTGSNQPMMGRAVGDSLLGRTAYRILRPLTLSELRFDEQHPGWSFLFGDSEAEVLQELEQRATANAITNWREIVQTGGFPQAVAMRQQERARLLNDYVTAFVQRDIREVIAIDRVDRFEKFFRVVAARVGQELNADGWSSEIAIPVTTTRRWLQALERFYLIDVIPPYLRNSSHRVIKAPKLYMIDSGLALAAAQETEPTGFHLENLIVSDAAVWKGNAPNRSWYHWRLGSGQEVDVVLEENGRLLPIEIKATPTAEKHQTRHLRTFCERHPNARRGLLLTNDPTIRIITPGIVAAPWWGVV